MKANPPAGIAASIVGAAGALLLTGCVAAPPAPAPPPRAVPTVSPAARAPAMAAPSPGLAAPLTTPAGDWRDAPLTPGTWSWSIEAGRSVARFAGDLLVLRCDAAHRVVELRRAGEAREAVPMSIDTTVLTRPLSGAPDAGPPPAIVLSFAAADPLLDAIAFSRGRFAVEAAGLPTLAVPSWPEVARVIEDCR